MIHLICTFEPVRIPLVRQFVEHYLHLGVERFHLCLQVEPKVEAAVVEHSRAEVQQTLDAYQIQLNSVLAVPFTATALRVHHDRIQDDHCLPGDWVVWADIDEFQVYPGEFKSLIQLAETLDIDYFRGYFVDRVAADGKLRPFDPEQSIWTQFPRQIKLDTAMRAGVTHKVTCCRSTVRVNNGNHFPVNPEPLCYYSDPVDVHHFKWDTTVISRLSRRLWPDFREQCPHWVESKSVLEFLAEHDGSLTTE
jgi:hypothetical protein